MEKLPIDFRGAKGAFLMTIWAWEISYLDSHIKIQESFFRTELWHNDNVWYFYICIKWLYFLYMYIYMYIELNDYVWWNDVVKICFYYAFGIMKLLMNLHHSWIHKYKHFQNRKDLWSLRMTFHLNQVIDFTDVKDYQTFI